MKLVATPLFLSICVASTAFADDPVLYTYTDQSLTTTAGGRAVGTVGAAGTSSNITGSTGGNSAGVTVQFSQSGGGVGNIINASGSGVEASATGGTGGDGIDDQYGGTSGGDGGNGGNGGVISVSSSGTFNVHTSGDNASSIHALSQGSAGGYASDEGSNRPGTVGGEGGAGAAVTVNLDSGASVASSGTNSHAILAQSLGANAGSNGVTYANLGDMQQYDGSHGGFSGLVTVTLGQNTTLTTHGNDSNGIVARSVSGNGGLGGSLNAGVGSAHAGQGGVGGNSGGVSINSAANITTFGGAANGIMAQAMSGGGGAGGDAGAFLSSQAGGPGVGGTVGDINLSSTGNITTSGAYSVGILAQSISGSGGVGGSASGSLIYDAGGSAAENSNAGAIYINNLAGIFTTSGDNAQAIVAQSIGGGGGMGGTAGGMLAVTGGTGGLGGAGGTVKVAAPNNSGLHISTYGQSAHGVVAQSVGGSGGMGGAAAADGANIASAIGGQAGSGGNGGSAQVNLMANITDRTPTILTGGPGAFGILSQSVGGGGGAGGGAYTVSAGMLADVSFAVGGHGGDGGNGGSADATLNGFIVQTGLPSAQNSTLAADSIGVAVQSIGGGGGQGGSGAALAYAIAVPAADEDPAANVTFSGAFAVGGKGGDGGNGGSATASVLNGSAVSTYGDGSLGVKVQSIGGGGGNGGDSSTLAATIGYGIKNRYIKQITPQTNAVNISAAVGGKGGNGGNGGNASLIGLGTNSVTDPVAKVSTYGDEATAVLVQSIGGGGGNAGTGNAKVKSYATSQNLDLTMSIGAAGGGGGNGGTAYALLDNTGQIETHGDGSKGVVVQSIGGGGGTGTGSSIDLTGLSDWVSAVTGFSGPIQAALLHDRHITVGAQGGAAGNGGQATVEHNAGSIIRTYGVDAPGIFVQSIGGGGGLGGSAAATAAASGVGSQSALAQLGDASSVSVSVNSTLNVGGGYGSSGNGGSVNVEAYGTIATVGDHSPGIMAQSVGAGGGRGAVATSGVEVNGQLSNSLKSISAALVLGNDVNLGYAIDPNYTIGLMNVLLGDGGGVDVDMNGSSITTGQAASVGGQANNGFQSFGVLAQSIGGGGGMAVDGTPGVQATAKLGAMSGELLELEGQYNGSQLAFGNGGAVTLNALHGTDVGQITTYGDAAHGIFLQSVGGGGGVFSAGSSQMAAGGGSGRTVTVGLGIGLNIGNGVFPVRVYGGDGGAVLADFNAKALTLNTSGHGAFGLLAQSIGGGGGTVAVAPGVATEISYFGAAGKGFSSGRDIIVSSAGGDGGAVTINMANASSAITTSGVGAHGIMAQSVGGGGGLIGNYRAGTVPVVSGNLSTDYVAAGTGSGGKISVTASGTIHTAGAGAMGVLAQSIGGGGGWIANEGNVFAGSTSYQNPGNAYGGGSLINIDLPQASISTTGQNSVGVWAQSIGADGGNTITVNVGSDTTSSSINGGNGQGSTDEDGGAGIVLSYGWNNQVNISAGSSVQALSGVAIKSLHGSTNISNHGTLSGSLVGTTTSDTTATLATSTTPISLSNFGTFANADLVQGHIFNQGHVFIGKTAGSDTMRVTGDFTQGRQGVLHLATDFVAKTADVLTVDGHAKLDGQIKVVANTLLPNRELTFLQAGSITSNAQLQGESDLFTYRTRHAGNSLALSVDRARFKETSALHGVADNLRAVGSHLQDVWGRGSTPELGKLYAALNRSAGQGASGYTNALNDLSPGVLAGPAALKQASMVSFSNSLMSCPAFEGTSTQMGEHDCVWGRITGNTSRLDASLGTSGLKSEGVMYQIGTQRSLSPNWFLGVAGAYENKTLRADDGRQHVKGDSGYLGVSLKYENGPWTFAGALTGSYGSFDNTRRIALMGAQAKSDSRVMSVGQRLRVSYTHAMAQSYIKPFIDLDVIHTRMPSFDERNAGALNLHLEGVNKWSAVLSPSVEVGGRFEMNNGYTVRPFASVGVSLSSTDTWESRARLASAPNGTDLFRSTLETGRVFGRLSGGVQVMSHKGMDVSLQYDGLLSSKVSSHSGSLKASWAF